MALRRITALTLLAAATLLGACVYRPDIQQGNLLSQEEIDQVTAGMTRSQVRFLLGTPMVSDPFAPQRWDYVYRLEYGRKRRISTAHFVVFFDGDKVTRVETLDPPDPPVDQLAQEQKKRKKQQDAAEDAGATAPPPAAAPPAEPPLPGTG
jgi:outer membrane protein assembly factor BamE